MPPEVVLDLSRLVSRLRHATPTGVDRVEMAYARELLRRIPDRLGFALLHPIGGYGRLTRAAAESFLDDTAHRWEQAEADARPSPAHLAAVLARTLPRRVPRPDGPRVLLQSSPHHLDQEDRVRRILATERARFVVLLHDLIPIEFPEYARPGGRDTHLSRVRTVARLADGVVANSQATRSAFLPYLDEVGRTVPTAVALLGADAVEPRAEPDHAQPYFVCLGTIEPRKNHLLLLHIWRSLSQRLGERATPRLVVVGRRGWENEQVVDLLERCPSLAGTVEERSGLSDAQVRDLIAGARALLLPSFAEGFGMPVPEALQLGTPVICSDLPALREAGGDVPTYLDPLDGPAWERAVLDFADRASAARAAQLDRLRRWAAPTWEHHLSIVLDLVERVA